MTGQDAVNVAKAFGERAGITAIVLTRVDGDARGGAALSMRAITGKPIVLIGVGERIEAIEPFHAERIAGRILGMGDVVSLVEKAVETVDQEEAEKLAAKLEKGRFDLDDLAAQLRQIRRMGGMGGMLAMLPGVAKIKKQLGDARIDESIIKRQEAIISSMTKGERRNPKLLNASRRRRIASGSGTSVPEINRLLKQYQDMADVTKKMKKLGPGAPRSRRAPARWVSLAKESAYVVEDPPGARRCQKAPLLQHCRRRLAQPARRPLHRKARDL